MGPTSDGTRNNLCPKRRFWSYRLHHQIRHSSTASLDSVIVFLTDHESSGTRVYYQMAMRSTVNRIRLNYFMERYIRGAPRYFSDDKGRVLSEEERAAENVYIQKMERERLEKQKRKAEKEKAAAEKEKAEKKAEEGTHKG